MKLKCTFEFVEMGDEIVAVPVGEGAAQIHGILKVNAQGQEIMRLLTQETTEEQMVNSLTAKYENDRALLESYVRVVLDNLRDANLLSE